MDWAIAFQPPVYDKSWYINIAVLSANQTWQMWNPIYTWAFIDGTSSMEDFPFPIVVNRLPLPECRWPQPEDTTWWGSSIGGTGKYHGFVWKYMVPPKLISWFISFLIYRCLLYLECDLFFLSIWCIRVYIYSCLSLSSWIMFILVHFEVPQAMGTLFNDPIWRSVDFHMCFFADW